MNGAVTVAPAGGADTGDVVDIADLPGGRGADLLAEEGIVPGARGGRSGHRRAFRRCRHRDSCRRSADLPGGGMLISAEKGWFLARAVNGAVTVAPVGAADTGRVFAIRDLPGGGVLIGAENGLFFGLPTPLSLAKVDIRDKANLDGSQIDARRKLTHRRS